MEEDILKQDVEDEFEEDIEDLEKEVEEKKSIKPTKKQAKEEPAQEQVTETYEAFKVSPRIGIVDTLTGETIEGFDIEKDQANIQLAKLILNKLDKIATACGA